MKNKGIPFIEQHIEKLVLGAAGAVFFSVVAWQVLGTHNNVMLDGRDAAPSEIDEGLVTRTQSLAQKLEQSGAPIQEKLGDRLKPQADSFAGVLGSAVAPKGDLPAVEPSLASILQSEGATSGQPFHVPKFPTLAMRPTIQVSDTIDATVIEQQSALKSMFTSATGPFDVTWTIPSAVIDVKSMRTELESTSTGAQIPGFWYRSTLFIIDVEFQRERKLADGSWGESTPVQALSGQFSFRPEIAKGADAGLRDAAFNYLTDKSAQRQILQPDFYLTKRSNFSPALLLSEDNASEASERSEDPVKAKLDDEIRRLRKDLARNGVETKRMQEDLEELGGPLEEAPKDDKKKNDDKENGGTGGKGGGGGGLGRPGGGLGGSAGGMDGRNKPGDAANRDRRIQLTKRLKKLQTDGANKSASLAKKLEEAGVSASASTAKSAASSDLATADTLVVWAHDLSVKAGELYRYRAVAKAYNPFFTNGSLLVDDQKKLADGFTLNTVASAWNEGFRVSPPIAFFVVDAQAGEGRLGVGQATVEIFRYFDGERRRDRMTIQPGDAIGGGRNKDGVDFDTGFFLVDVYADPSTERSGTDRRPAAVAVVQNSLGDRYEIRIPKDDASSQTRTDFEDEIELAKADKEQGQGAAKDDGKDDGKGAGKPTPPKGPGSGSGGGRDGDPNYGR